MRNIFRKYLTILIISSIFCFAIGHSFSFAQDIPPIPTAELPILITSSGQSPEAFVVKALLDRVKISSFYNELMKAEEIKDIKTLLIAMGGSSKGLGAAGIEPEDELDRLRNILDTAEKQGIVMFGIHIGEEARRGALSAKFIELTTPRMKYLIVIEDGNKDGYFSKVSEEKKIPLFIVKSVAELGEMLKKVFQNNN